MSGMDMSLRPRVPIGIQQRRVDASEIGGMEQAMERRRKMHAVAVHAPNSSTLLSAPRTITQRNDAFDDNCVKIWLNASHIFNLSALSCRDWRVSLLR